MDRISKLPTGIIETILCLLPIQESARTCILSKEWRYNWIKIPKLVFKENEFQVTTNETELSIMERKFDEPSKRKKMDKRCKLFYAIYQVLLMHEGPIHEFTLCMGVDDSCVEIDHIIRHLSKRNTVKILKLDFRWKNEWFELPVSLFLFNQLTNMYLYYCAIFHERSFKEFGSLATLHLRKIQTYDKTLVALLSNCPVLKELSLHCSGADIIYIENTPMVDLFKCFVGLEYLSIWFPIVLAFDLERVPKEFPTKFNHLKYLCMKRMCISHKHALPFLLLLIRCSPNLEKLKIENEDIEYVEEEDLGSITMEEYSDIMLEHLNEFEYRLFRNYDCAVDFVKVVLAKSPVLKKLTIFPCGGCDEVEELHLLKTLYDSPCASPLVELILTHR